MGNSVGRLLSYTPRLTDAEAYERLPPTLRKALQEGVNDWCAYSTLRFFEKHGLKKTLAWICHGDATYMRKGLVPARGRAKKVPSTFTACRVQPLRIYNVIGRCSP